MNPNVCIEPNCTFSETGICLLSFEPSACPQLTSHDSPDLSPPGFDPVQEINVVLEKPLTKPRFKSSTTLSTDDVHGLMSNRYATVIGILGEPDAGKTALLASLYLLLSHGKLAGFEYRDSKSLMAFEEISRGSRQWINGQPPEQMTTHTELKDERRPGFLHLQLFQHPTQTTRDIFLPDLPGEWSVALKDKNRTDRLSFIKSASAIWVMIDGVQLSNLNTRKAAVYRAKMLIRRTLEFLGSSTPKIFIVITRSDKGHPESSILQEIISDLKAENVPVEIVYVASFSNTDEVKAGTGIAELLSATIKQPTIKPYMYWTDNSFPDQSRQIFQFKHMKDVDNE